MRLIDATYRYNVNCIIIVAIAILAMLSSHQHFLPSTVFVYIISAMFTGLRKIVVVVKEG